MDAYVLIETKVGHSTGVTEALKRMGYMADNVIGHYDVIVTVTGADRNDISATVEGKIHPLTGILRTTTCLKVR